MCLYVICVIWYQEPPNRTYQARNMNIKELKVKNTKKITVKKTYPFKKNPDILAQGVKIHKK